MAIRAKAKVPDIKLSPDKKIVEKLSKEDRLPYGVIIGMLLFVIFVLFIRPNGEIDATFWIVTEVMIIVALIIVVHLVLRDKKSPKEKAQVKY